MYFAVKRVGTMKRLVLTSLVLSIAMALVASCTVVPTDSQRPVRPESELYILTVEIDPPAASMRAARWSNLWLWLWRATSSTTGANPSSQVEVVHILGNEES